MAIKDTTPGYESASERTSTETLADGTQYTAEFTDTVNPDDPTQPASHMTFTEIAPDGTETVREAIVTADSVYLVEEDSLLEEAVEATLGVEIPDELTPYDPGQPAGDAASNTFPESSDYQTSGTDFTVGNEMFAPAAAPTDVSETAFAEMPVDPSFGVADPSYSATPVSTAPYESPVDAQFEAYNKEQSEAAAAEAAEQQAHAQAATEAQASADEFIAKGDYAAAAEARAVAENESWEAGDDNMLGASDAQDLSFAAEKQEEAEYYNEQQAEFAKAGDYEAARDAASNSAYATGNADFYAGGDDHTGQADAEYANMDNAVWQEGLRADDLENAAYQAEMGNYDAAQSSLDSAAYRQETADYYGDKGEHGGIMADYDPSSAVETGGSYESTYDASAAAVDTGFDSSMTSSVDTTSMDTGTDDV